MNSQMSLGVNGSYGYSEHTPPLNEYHSRELLRSFWFSGNEAAVTMDDSSVFKVIVGKITYMPPTGAFATIDGQHIPTVSVQRVETATDIDRKAYKDRKKQVQLDEEKIMRSALKSS